MPDGLPDLVSTEPIDTRSRTPLTWRLPVLARAGLDRGVHHVDLTLVGAASTDVRYLYNSTLPAAGVDTTTVAGDAIATWRGRWRHTVLRGQLAWHRSVRRESASDPSAAAIPQLLTAYVPTVLADDPVVAAACNDDPAVDRYPKVPNCPVPTSWFTSGGAGPLSTVTADRPSVTVDLAHRIGSSVVRAGATGEDARLITETRFTGDAQIRSLFPGHIQERRFTDPAQTCHVDIALPCPTVDRSSLRYRTRYTAAYVEDTWYPDPAFTIDAGLRWELMWVGTALHFSNQLAPRLGASWDPVGGGRSRLWTSMGRSYALLPAGLGPTLVASERTVDTIQSPFGVGRAVETGAPVPIAPGIEPIAQDELTTGAQLALARTVRATVWLQGRWLSRGLETTGGIFDNPGRQGGVPAVRDTGVLAAELATAPYARFVLRAGYMYGRTIGSWTGAFDPREGAVLYAGSDFDAPPVNLTGRLPTDLGHRAYIEAARGGQLGSLTVSVAARLSVGSGRPRNAIGATDDGVAYLIPRGSAGRGPLLTQANLRVAAHWPGLDITLDLFNVFDRREAVTVDEIYATGAIHPIDQGARSDLVFLKTDTGENAVRRASYATGTSYQPPLSAVVGVHYAL